MSQTATQPGWLTIEQLAERWGVSYDTVRRQVQSESIPSLRLGRVTRISIKAVEEIEAKASSVARAEIKRSLRRAARFVSSGKDHFPDC